MIPKSWNLVFICLNLCHFVCKNFSRHRQKLSEKLRVNIKPYIYQIYFIFAWYDFNIKASKFDTGYIRHFIIFSQNFIIIEAFVGDLLKFLSRKPAIFCKKDTFFRKIHAFHWNSVSNYFSRFLINLDKNFTHISTL